MSIKTEIPLRAFSEKSSLINLSQDAYFRKYHVLAIKKDN